MNAVASEEAGTGGGAAAAAVTLEELRKKMADFARERDWEQYHSPRNLLLAMVRPSDSFLDFSPLNLSWLFSLFSLSL